MFFLEVQILLQDCRVTSPENLPSTTLQFATARINSKIASLHKHDHSENLNFCFGSLEEKEILGWFQEVQLEWGESLRCMRLREHVMHCSCIFVILCHFIFFDCYLNSEMDFPFLKLKGITRAAKNILRPGLPLKTNIYFFLNCLNCFKHICLKSSGKCQQIFSNLFLGR